MPILSSSFLQFRGAFKRFVKSRKEKDMELRWTRINQMDLNTDFSRNRFGRYYHRDSCNLAVARLRNSNVGVAGEYRRNINNDFISKNDMISYGATSESHSAVEDKFQSFRRSLPSNLHESKFYFF